MVVLKRLCSAGIKGSGWSAVIPQLLSGQKKISGFEDRLEGEKGLVCNSD